MKSYEIGVESVLTHLNQHNDCYVIIGGIATKLLLEEKGLPFRETKDFDIVLLADSTKEEFAKDIVGFLKAGKYKNGYSNDKRVCYRFVDPETNGYPKIIELFSKENNQILAHHLRKISITYDEEQLSAIVLNQDIFEFVKKRKIISKEGLPIVDTLGIIALKAHAYFQNKELYDSGMIIGQVNYLKHRVDVIRLLLSLTGEESPIDMPSILKDDCFRFISLLEETSDVYRNIPHGSVQLVTLINLFKHLFCE